MSNLTAMTDYELVTLYSKGNDEAFDTLMARHQTHMFAYILRLVDDVNRANDIFQDTFVKAIVNMRRGRYADTGKFSAWLMRIAHNIVVDYSRDNTPTPYLSEENHNEQLYNNPDMSEDSCESRLLEEADTNTIELLISRLPAPQQEIVHLRYYEDLTFKEIAQITGVSINTSLGRMRYALINLRKLICQYNLDLAV